MSSSWKILFFDKNKEIVKTVLYIGDYNDARRKADKILYGENNDDFWGYRVEFNW